MTLWVLSDRRVVGMVVIRESSMSGEGTTGIDSVSSTIRLRPLHIREPQSSTLCVSSTNTTIQRYAPAYERFGSQISAIHFIGPNKPWKDLPYRAPTSARQEEKAPEASSPSSSSSGFGTAPQQSYAFGALVDRWFDTYDRHYRQVPEQEFEERRYENVWDEPTPPSEVSLPPPSGAPLGLEELKQLALQGGSTDSKREGEGEYRSLPLEGRIDLMRPKQEPPTEDKTEVREHQDQQAPGQQPSVESRQGPQELQTLQPLPTPGPNEVPPSPYFGTVSLPPSTGPSTPGQAGPSQPVQQEPHQPPSMPPLEHRDSNTTPRPGDFHRHGEPPQQSYQEPPPQQHYEPPPPPRPVSPPLLKWNPAVEPPPNEAPPASAFREQAYFPNVWDLPPSAGKLHHELTGQSAPDSSAFFQAPPPSRIPEQLVQEGHYANVIGQHQPPSAPQHHRQETHTHHYFAPPPPPPSHSQPDISKVHTVFPWEQRPIHRPARVFPEGDSAPPGSMRYIEDMPPEPETKPAPEHNAANPSAETDTQMKPASPSLHIPMPSPTIGFPSSKGYSNAWDSVASIQRYASRLVKPPPPPVQAPISWSSRRRSDSYRSRGERSDASSIDGDVEDEVDDEDEGGNGPLSGNEVMDVDKKDTGKGKREKSGTKSPPSASGSSTRSKSGKRDYRSFGVQTIPKDVRSVAVQASQQTSSPPTGRTDGGPPHRHKKSGSTQHSRQGSSASSPSTSTHLDLPKPTTALQDPKLGQEPMAAASPSIVNVQSFIRPPVRQQQQNVPSGMISPRLHDTYSYESPARTPPPGTPGATTPATTARPAVQASRTPSSATQDVPPGPPPPPMMIMRTPSTETADSSTVGPISPMDSPVVGSRKRIGRTWDPATGVDVFKRASEEVLARFLRMGSWEDDTTQAQRV